MFQAPSPTQFDLRFSIAGVPVRVHPLFWLIVLLFGSTGALIQIPIWIFVVFISILFHELGHAMAFRFYGIRSQIILHGMGGLTIPEATPWGTSWANVSPSPKQEIIISLAGPFSGFLFAALVEIVLTFSGGTVQASKLFGSGGSLFIFFINMLLYVNIFWGIFNLLPVIPLDGGQVTRNILIQVDPYGGARKSLWVSVIAGVVIALGGWILLKSIFIPLLFGLLAFQSYQLLQSRF